MTLFTIAWITVRELIYERVFYLLLAFAALALGFSLLLGQLTYAEQAKITIDFMLAGIEISMVLFCVFMGIGLFKREMLLGSVAMVLSKPISRSTFLLGKFVGQSLVQYGVIACMLGVTLAVQSAFRGSISGLAIAQATLMIALEVTVLTAIAYFFAVNAGTITASVVTLSVFAVGHTRESLVYQYGQHISNSWFWPIAMSLVPDLEIFNMKTIASYGYTLGWTQMGWAFLYAACCAAFFLVAGAICFSHKDIAT